MVHEARDKASRKLNGGQTRKRWGGGEGIQAERIGQNELCSVSAVVCLSLPSLRSCPLPIIPLCLSREETALPFFPLEPKKQRSQKKKIIIKKNITPDLRLLAPSLTVSSFDLLIYPLRSTNEKYINKNKQTNKAKQNTWSGLVLSLPRLPRLQSTRNAQHVQCLSFAIYLRAQNLSPKKVSVGHFCA